MTARSGTDNKSLVSSSHEPHNGHQPALRPVDLGPGNHSPLLPIARPHSQSMKGYASALSSARGLASPDMEELLAHQMSTPSMQHDHHHNHNHHQHHSLTQLSRRSSALSPAATALANALEQSHTSVFSTLNNNTRLSLTSMLDASSYHSISPSRRDRDVRHRKGEEEDDDGADSSHEVLRDEDDSKQLACVVAVETEITAQTPQPTPALDASVQPSSVSFATHSPPMVADVVKSGNDDDDEDDEDEDARNKRKEKAARKAERAVRRQRKEERRQARLQAQVQRAMNAAQHVEEQRRHTPPLPGSPSAKPSSRSVASSKGVSRGGASPATDSANTNGIASNSNGMGPSGMTSSKSHSPAVNSSSNQQGGSDNDTKTHEDVSALADVAAAAGGRYSDGATRPAPEVPSVAKKHKKEAKRRLKKSKKLTTAERAAKDERRQMKATRREEKAKLKAEQQHSTSVSPTKGSRGTEFMASTTPPRDAKGNHSNRHGRGKGGGDGAVVADLSPAPDDVRYSRTTGGEHLGVDDSPVRRCSSAQPHEPSRQLPEGQSRFVRRVQAGSIVSAATDGVMPSSQVERRTPDAFFNSSESRRRLDSNGNSPAPGSSPAHTDGASSQKSVSSSKRSTNSTRRQQQQQQQQQQPHHKHHKEHPLPRSPGQSFASSSLSKHSDCSSRTPPRKAAGSAAAAVMELKQKHNNNNKQQPRITTKRRSPSSRSHSYSRSYSYTASSVSRSRSSYSSSYSNHSSSDYYSSFTESSDDGELLCERIDLKEGLTVPPPISAFTDLAYRMSHGNVLQPYAEPAVIREWNLTEGCWGRVETYVVLHPEPFSRGNMRASYHMVDLKRLNCKLVAKRYLKTSVSDDQYYDDVSMHSISDHWARLYNSWNPPKKVKFVPAAVLELRERHPPLILAMEPELDGAFRKYNNNCGYVPHNARWTPQAFSHFTYQASDRQLMIVDIQGVGDIYTDPQILSPDGEGYGRGNLGIRGIRRFVQSHRCNPVCKALELTPLVVGPASDPPQHAQRDQLAMSGSNAAATIPVMGEKLPPKVFRRTSIDNNNNNNNKSFPVAPAHGRSPSMNTNTSNTIGKSPNTPLFGNNTPPAPPMMMTHPRPQSGDIVTSWYPFGPSRQSQHQQQQQQFLAMPQSPYGPAAQHNPKFLQHIRQAVSKQQSTYFAPSSGSGVNPNSRSASLAPATQQLSSGGGGGGSGSSTPNDPPHSISINGSHKPPQLQPVLLPAHRPAGSGGGTRPSPSAPKVTALSAVEVRPPTFRRRR